MPGNLDFTSVLAPLAAAVAVPTVGGGSVGAIAGAGIGLFFSAMLGSQQTWVVGGSSKIGEYRDPIQRYGFKVD